MSVVVWVEISAPVAGASIKDSFTILSEVKGDSFEARTFLVSPPSRLTVASPSSQTSLFSRVCAQVPVTAPSHTAIQEAFVRPVSSPSLATLSSSPSLHAMASARALFRLLSTLSPTPNP